MSNSDAPLSEADGDSLVAAQEQVHDIVADLDPYLAASLFATELVLESLTLNDGDVAKARAHIAALVEFTLRALVSPEDEDVAPVVRH